MPLSFLKFLPRYKFCELRGLKLNLDLNKNTLQFMTTHIKLDEINICNF